jgi:LacI family transcriptional regulator
MRDVAALAGVATSTVSRVMSQPDRISPRTRETVLKAMRELGYPGAGQRAAGRSRSATVGVLVPDIANPFFFDVIRGTQDRLSAAGYMQVLVNTEESAEVEAAFLDLLATTAVGAILAAPRQSDAALAATAARFPLVTVNREVPGVSNVVIDSGSAVEQAVEHLASLGHRRLCYVQGPGVSWSNGERWRRCVRAAARLGLETVTLGPFAPKTTSGGAAADALLNTGATAAIAFNDLLAIGMLQRLAARGVVVPDQISLVGCDDIFGADFCSPPLTTLTAPVMDAGRQAIALLLEQAERTPRPAGRSVVLPVHLTIRGSTGAYVGG